MSGHNHRRPTTLRTVVNALGSDFGNASYVLTNSVKSLQKRFDLCYLSSIRAQWSDIPAWPYAERLFSEDPYEASTTPAPPSLVRRRGRLPHPDRNDNRLPGDSERVG